MFTKTAKAARWMKKYLRLVDYIAAAQLYLKDNFFLEEELKPEHIKDRILGHWGTVPGLSFIYANLNYLVYKYKCEVMMVTGPGHGAPAILSNLFVDGTLHEFYKQYTVDGKGAAKIIKDFSWPRSPFPSHVTPSVPGSILEGGELGYSLATAYGSVLDNADLITAVAVGDGEAESGPLSAAWHSNKWLNPKTCGAVLPIVHINGYKISNPTLYGTMSNDELYSLFTGYGYDVFIVEGMNIEAKMIRTLEKAYRIIRHIQKRARSAKKLELKPKWPVILLRSPKGWHGVSKFKQVPIEGSFHSHGIPLTKPQSDPAQLAAVEKWLRSYKVHKLIDDKGRPLENVMKYVPKGKDRIGMCKHAIGGNMMKDLKLPDPKKYLKFKKNYAKGALKASNMQVAGQYLRDVFKKNASAKNFRMMCPDEMESNLLSNVFEATERAYMWPVPKNAEHVSTDGRVMEMLSEHTLQGWMQGYILTGRHGIFVSYEAFTTIISSMVDQHAKFLKQAMRIKWRKPVPAAVYINSSVGWRQEHNGFSHQNPSFVSNVLQKHGEFSQVYYPADANSFLAALEETLKRKDAICVIVAGKRPLPQCLTIEEARKQAKRGIGVWNWVSGEEASKSPDVVLASAGDYMTHEALSAANICKSIVPEMKIRFVNVSELTSIAIGDYATPHFKTKLSDKEFEKYFTKDKSVVFAYHGYANDVEHILWGHTAAERFSIHGYREEGSTTTPGDMLFRNQVSALHLTLDLIDKAAKHNKAIARKKGALNRRINEIMRKQKNHIVKHGTDLPMLKEMEFGA